jgi:hypothetical protein
MIRIIIKIILSIVFLNIAIESGKKIGCNSDIIINYITFAFILGIIWYL